MNSCTCVTMSRQTGGLGNIHIPLLSDLNKQISRDYGVLLEGPGIALRCVHDSTPHMEIVYLVSFTLPTFFLGGERLHRKENGSHLVCRSIFLNKKKNILFEASFLNQGTVHHRPQRCGETHERQRPARGEERRGDPSLGEGLPIRGDPR